MKKEKNNIKMGKKSGFTEKAEIKTKIKSLYQTSVGTF